MKHFKQRKGEQCRQIERTQEEKQNILIQETNIKFPKNISENNNGVISKLIGVYN